MNGIGHYEEAERLLDRAKSEHGVLNAAEVAVLVAEAQVHATLAQAAATALIATQQYVGSSNEITAWSYAVQPSAFKQDPCAEHCVDDGRDGCYPRCVDRMKATTRIDNEEPPF